MKSATRSAYLLNYVFLAGLLLLALNDHLWKDLYGNWLTGKLSDVAGVVILPLFLAAVFRLRAGAALVATVLFFGWWKSPLSQGALDVVNGLGSWHFARVVDYSDFLAFLSLPLSWWALRTPERFAVSFIGRAGRQRIVRFAVLPLTVLLFVATSQDIDPAEFGPSIVGCCGAGPVVDSVGQGRVFIPTAFSPDGDGLNDIFRPVTDTGIASISLLVFSLERIDTVFMAQNVAEFTEANGWDGREDGIIEPKSYEFEATVIANTGDTAVYFNRLCSLPCAEPTGLPRPRSLENCTFADQADAAGFLDRSAVSAEVFDCYD